jgi:hypothetical protein
MSKITTKLATTHNQAAVVSTRAAAGSVLLRFTASAPRTMPGSHAKPIPQVSTPTKTLSAIAAFPRPAAAGRGGRYGAW